MSHYETVAHTTATIASLVAIIAPAAVSLGLALRVGPGRAISLALSGRLVSAGTVPSQRKAEVDMLRNMAANVAADRYCIVVAPRA